MITQLLTYEEGYRKLPYLCSEGYPTIGIGKRIGCKGVPLSAYRISCSRQMAELWLEEEVKEILIQLNKYTWFIGLDYSRQAIMVSMAYQMGVEGLLCFSNMIRALEANEYPQAAVEALDSRWYRQTPERAQRHAMVIDTGDIHTAYPSFGD